MHSSHRSIAQLWRGCHGRAAPLRAFLRTVTGSTPKSVGAEDAQTRPSSSAAARAASGPPPWADDPLSLPAVVGPVALPVELVAATNAVLGGCGLNKKALRKDAEGLHDFLFSREVVSAAQVPRGTAPSKYLPTVQYGAREAVAYLAGRQPVCYAATLRVLASKTCSVFSDSRSDGGACTPLVRYACTTDVHLRWLELGVDVRPSLHSVTSYRKSSR
jgi:hypothetical protein